MHGRECGGAGAGRKSNRDAEHKATTRVERAAQQKCIGFLYWGAKKANTKMHPFRI